jgi:hypothetical protein
VLLVLVTVLPNALQVKMLLRALKFAPIDILFSATWQKSAASSGDF